MRDARWLDVVRSASGFQTPFYLIWPDPFAQKKQRLDSLFTGKAHLAQWYSYKTQPVPKMAEFALGLGMGCEVVSSHELFAALQLGFPAERVLVNGVGKRAWLSQSVENINVIFDSVDEARYFAHVARERKWHVGVRVAVSGQVDPDNPAYPAQFGVDPKSVGEIARVLDQAGVPLEILHFHLRSNVASPADYDAAIQEVGGVASENLIAPRVIDVGGGLSDGMTPTEAFPLSEYANVISSISSRVPSASEIWLENGRYLLAPSSVLVVTVLERKVRGGHQILICDGGRTNHALVSDWEEHHVEWVGAGDQRGRIVDTIICGPTCMAFDWIYRGAFSDAVRPGDRIVYFDAGAYHIPWEARFSAGLCRVLWTVDGRTYQELRAPETPEEWLAVWKA